MKSVVLRLEGPLQSWATQSKLGVRDTDREPSKSGVLGLVGAALGMDRGDDVTLARLSELELAVRVDRAGSLLHDYHTAGGGTFRGKPYTVWGVKDCVPSHRYYLQGASFVAALGGADHWVERIAQALEEPRWPLYLGRRSCPPSEPVLVQMTKFSPVDAVRSAPLAMTGIGGEVVASRKLKLLTECPPEEGGQPRYDVPISFAVDAKRYGVRHVRTDWVGLAAVQA
ncbi:MAG TPA: type I-E CRISPR-associated protein Cas5/CasD [Myxococcales bacterium]|nr:type I-E CRISPR-associated protein Cas5/CasD [Myxococcales bacterium]